MKLVMDSDCLIKLTKAGLKERVCSAWEITIPASVRRETVEQAPGLPDATRILQNISEGRVRVAAKTLEGGKGEDAVLTLYRQGGFQAVATDDERFIRYLRGLSVPYAVPAVIVIRLFREGVLKRNEAGDALEALRPHISAEEYAATCLMIEGGKIS